MTTRMVLRLTRGRAWLVRRLLDSQRWNERARRLRRAVRVLGDLPGGGDDVGLDDLRRRVLGLCSLVCAVSPLLIMLTFSLPNNTPAWISGLSLAIYAVGITTYAASRWDSVIGGWVFIAGLLVLATACLWTDPLERVIFFAPLVVMFASAFASVFGGLLTAAAVTAILLYAVGAGRPVGDADVITILLLTWASVPVSYLASEPIRIALTWSWAEFQRAEREADRARRNQAELAQTVKSLNAAQDLLENMNDELARARVAAEEARRVKSEFAATISHELRTPLNLIIGFSEMMAASTDSYSDRPLPPAYQRDIDTVYRNARHLSSLIDDILDLSQIDAARMGLFRESLSLAELTREAIGVVDPLFRRRGLSLTASVPEGLPSLYADRVRVRQILINLLNNAARFTDHGGVRVSAWQENQDIVVSVTDTGSGIPPEDLPMVFEEFRQVHGPVGRRAGGSGLGLTISKRIVELHGGSMWAESEPGEGSTFYFTLPVRENVISVPFRQEWQTWAEPIHRGAKAEPALVVWDDDPEASHLLQRHIEGHQIVMAGALADVRRLVESGGVRAVIVTGPSESEAAERAAALRSGCPHIPIIACPLTGRRDIARELGAVDYLVKPVFAEQLVLALDRSGVTSAGESGLARPADVLVVDDDPDLVDLLVRMLRSSGRMLDVRRAYGGAEGLASMRERRPDLLFLDLMMVGTSGYEVIEAMRADVALRGVPVIVVSAQGKREETINASSFTILRGDGLSIREATQLLGAGLEALVAP